MRKLVFIAGLGHSGSTLLDMLLSCQGGIVGLGETEVVLHTRRRDEFLAKYHTQVCSCGRPTEQCPVWGRMKPHLIDPPAGGYPQLYGELLDIAHQETGKTVFTDSSKHLPALTRLHSILPELGVQPENFYVIHLVKDVRSYTVSHQRRKQAKHWSIRRTFQRWKRKNMEIEEFIGANSIKAMTVGYEELALSTEFTLSRLMMFLGLANEQIVTDLSKSTAHVGFGNSMRHDDSKNKQVVYDFRWFLSRDVSLAYALAPWIQSRNRKWVYGNVHGALSQKSLFSPPV